MNSNEDILPINELPDEMRRIFNDIESNLQTRDHLTARELMGQILEYYVQNDREIPEEIEIAYAHLLVLENPVSEFLKQTKSSELAE